MVWGAMKNLLFPSFRFLGGADYAPANIAHKLIQVLREKLPSDEYLIPSDVTPFKANWSFLTTPRRESQFSNITQLSKQLAISEDFFPLQATSNYKHERENFFTSNRKCFSMAKKERKQNFLPFLTQPEAHTKKKERRGERFNGWTWKVDEKRRDPKLNWALKHAWTERKSVEWSEEITQQRRRQRKNGKVSAGVKWMKTCDPHQRSLLLVLFAHDFSKH